MRHLTTNLRQQFLAEPRNLIGIGLILLSYLTCWPVISALGMMSVWMEKPDLIVIGGPAAYLLSHLTFLIGLVVAGRRYVGIINRPWNRIRQT